MGSKSDYLENSMLDARLGGGWSKPATVYLAVFTVTPSDSGGGTEVSGGAYARVTITNNATNWPAASSGTKTSGVQFAYPVATANWGTLVAWGIYDSLTGGNLGDWGTLSPTVSVVSGDSVHFNAGDITITED